MFFGFMFIIVEMKFTVPIMDDTPAKWKFQEQPYEVPARSLDICEEL
jgi:hypothetical protein